LKQDAFSLDSQALKLQHKVSYYLIILLVQTVMLRRAAKCCGSRQKHCFPPADDNMEWRHGKSWAYRLFLILVTSGLPKL